MTEEERAIAEAFADSVLCPSPLDNMSDPRVSQDAGVQGNQGFDPQASTSAGMNEMKDFLTQALAASQESILARMKEELSASVSASVHDAVSSSSGLSGIKRRAESIKNEGIKKQFVPLEESLLRMQAVQEPLKAFVDGDLDSISPDDAAKMSEYLDEGIQLVSKRLQQLEIAETQGWQIAKKMEENQLVLQLDEESQKLLKKAKKEVKEEEKEREAKKAKKSSSKPSTRPPFRRSFFPRGGFHGGFQRGGGSLVVDLAAELVPASRATSQATWLRSVLARVWQQQMQAEQDLLFSNPLA